MALSGPTTAAREAKQRDGDWIAVTMGAVAIYKGDIVIAKAADGLAIPVYETGAAGDTFLGVAIETVAVPVSGTTKIKIALEGVFVFDKAVAAQADVGNHAWTNVAAGPKNILAGTAGTGNGLRVGKIVGRVYSPTGVVSTTQLRVAIAPEVSAVMT